ncbi:hypothetical protein Tco_1405510 [Tanacetum coccineum]
MHFFLSNMSVVYVLTTPIPEDGENATMDQISKRNKWDSDDYVCRGLILKGMSDPLFDIYQNVESRKELWDSLKAKYMAEDASSKKFLVQFRITSLIGFPAQSIRSSIVIALDSPYLLFLITETSQSRPHESRKSPTVELFDFDPGRISIHHYVCDVSMIVASVLLYQESSQRAETIMVRENPRIVTNLSDFSRQNSIMDHNEVQSSQRDSVEIL